jgi:hypothetical protein
MPPRGEFRFPLLLAMGSPDSAMCVVTWRDRSGEERSTRATVRV